MVRQAYLRWHSAEIKHERHTAAWQHGSKWRVQKRRDGRLRKWTNDTFEEAQTKRHKVFE